jgi:hypothetical protein
MPALGGEAGEDSPESMRHERHFLCGASKRQFNPLPTFRISSVRVKNPRKLP